MNEQSGDDESGAGSEGDESGAGSEGVESGAGSEGVEDGATGSDAGGTEPVESGTGESGTAEEQADADRSPWTPERLHRLRTDSTERQIALIVAGIVGLGLVWMHWLGLFAAGALVGLVSRDLPRALAAGLAFGLLVLVVHVLAAPEMGFGAFLALTPVSYVAIGAALVAPVWGALARGVF